MTVTITPETVREAMASASVTPHARIRAMAPDLARAYLAAMEENARLKAGRRAIAAHAEPIKGTPCSCGSRAWCEVFDRAAAQEPDDKHTGSLLALHEGERAMLKSERAAPIMAHPTVKALVEAAARRARARQRRRNWGKSSVRDFFAWITARDR